MPSKTRRGEPDLFSGLEPVRVPVSPVAPVEPVAPVAQAPAIITGRFAEIAVEGPVRGTFTYLLPEHFPTLQPGARVLVPFGRRPAYGYFLGEFDAAAMQRQTFDPAKIKPVMRVLAGQENSPLLTAELLKLARWIAHRYAAPLGATLAAMVPAGVKRGAAGARIRMVATLKSAAELTVQADARTARSPGQAAILRLLATLAQPIPAAELLEKTQSSDAALKALAKAGWLSISEVRPDDGLNDGDAAEPGDSGWTLNDEQQVAYTAIETGLTSGAYAGFLLQGVTGSGKTEVYLRALSTALARGRQGIVLVPEIALTPQTARRFQQRLGSDRVAVLHSHVTGGERADAWRAIRAGKIDVVVGARSALFAPLPRLGIVVVDEEHETAFKQESTPRYNARDVAAELARIAGAVLVLGSATPSLESLHAARTGTLRHLHLSRRVAGRPLPPVEIIDLNQENMETEKYTYLSRRLIGALDVVLHRKEQAILFMNRRGFATVLTCLRCGYTERCQQCDITLTSHRAPVMNPKNTYGNAATAAVTAVAPVAKPLEKSSTSTPVKGEHPPETLICHYCGFSKPAPSACSGCGSPCIKHWGLGTERVENEVRKAFPNARLARMDSDTMAERTAYATALTGFRQGKTDILIGTQMIAKGLDFPNVTLVGVVLADTALHMPDFRSRERTFQLLAQVAGRAGRGEKGGVVIIQTHLPRDPAVRAAAQHDFESFTQGELKERREFSYPPFTRLARVLIRGLDLTATLTAANAAAAALREQCAALPGVHVLGPSEASIAKLEGYFRQHIIVKSPSSELLSELFAHKAGDALSKLKGADATVDVDPLSMM